MHGGVCARAQREAGGKGVVCERTWDVHLSPPRTTCLPAASLPPACSNPKWIQQNLVPAAQYNKPDFKSTALGSETATSKGKVDVFVTATTNKSRDYQPPAVYPTAGTHIIPLQRGEVVQVGAGLGASLARGLGLGTRSAAVVAAFPRESLLLPARGCAHLDGI